MPHSRRLVLAAILSVSVLIVSLGIWFSQKSGEQAHTNCLTGSQSMVEFKLIPYARVYDVTNRKKVPEFLFESHYRLMRLEPGVYVFRFDYGNRRSWRNVKVEGLQKCRVSVDLRF